MTEEEIRAIIKVAGEGSSFYVYRHHSSTHPEWHASLTVQWETCFASANEKQEVIDAVWEKYVNRAGDRSAG